MPKDLINFLFGTSQDEDALSVVTEGADVGKVLDDMFEHMATMEGVKPVKTSLSSALKRVGVNVDAHDGLALDPMGFCLITSHPDSFASLRTLLTDPTKMHELASLGWVATFPGDKAQVNEEPEFHIRFIELTVADAGSSDTVESPLAIAKKGRKDATQTAALSSPPVKAKGSGIGKATDGATPRKTSESAAFPDKGMTVGCPECGKETRHRENKRDFTIAKCDNCGAALKSLGNHKGQKQRVESEASNLVSRMLEGDNTD